MKILAVGGGSGGHVTPIAAVIRSLNLRNSSYEIRMWCDGAFQDQAKDIISAVDPQIRVDVILAGKFRRYHGISFFRQLRMLSDVVLPNIVDFFKIAGGFVQCTLKMIVWRPDVVFCKGGFVCLPAGFAASLLRIPVVLHDSDAHPGVANRMLSRLATYIATGATLDNYNYPLEKASYVGIPINPDFHKLSSSEVADFKKGFDFETERPLVVVTGGGLGAQPINQAIITVAHKLVEDMNVILISGTAQYDEVKEALADISSKKLKIFSFVSKDILSILGAGDVVVARAGATSLLELAALAKPVVLVPNPNLTGGHQLKNADYYEKKDACVVVSEKAMLDDPSVLLDAIRDVATDKKRQEQLSYNMHRLAMPRAADDVAELLEKAARSRAKKVDA